MSELPYNLEAERSVLGAMLLNPEIVDDVVQVLHGTPRTVFYSEMHQHLYQAVLQLHRSGQPIDSVLLVEQLNKNNSLEQTGGVSYVAGLTSAVPTSANAEYYAQLVRDAWVLRTVADSSARLYHECLSKGADAREVCDRVEKVFSGVTSVSHRNQVTVLEDVLPAAIQKLHDIAARPGEMTGIPSGIQPIDKMTWGWQDEDLIIVGARPSVGKTAFMLTCAYEAAARHDASVLLFSLEMSKEQLAQRLIYAIGRVNVACLREGFNVANVLRQVNEAASHLARQEIYIDDTSGMTLFELRSKVRQHVRRHGRTLVMIDYLQLLKLGSRCSDRNEEVAEISRGLKSLAREVKSPVIALSQLSREAEKISDVMHKTSTLRESGAVEQDADVVIMLQRPGEKAIEAIKGQLIHPDHAELIVQGAVAKQRNGPTGVFNLYFDKPTQRLMTMAQYKALQSPPTGPPLVAIPEQEEVPF